MMLLMMTLMRVLCKGFPVFCCRRYQSYDIIEVAWWCHDQEWGVWGSSRIIKRRGKEWWCLLSIIIKLQNICFTGHSWSCYVIIELPCNRVCPVPSRPWNRKQQTEQGRKQRRSNKSGSRKNTMEVDADTGMIVALPVCLWWCGGGGGSYYDYCIAVKGTRECSQDCCLHTDTHHPEEGQVLAECVRAKEFGGILFWITITIQRRR